MSLVFNHFTGTFDFTGGSGGGGSTSPALPFNSVQFNNAGSFGGSANLTWDGANVLTGGDANLAAWLASAEFTSTNIVSQDGEDQIAGMVIYTAGDEYSGGFLELLASGGTRAAPTPMIQGNPIGDVDWFGHDGTTFSYGAALSVLARENWTPTANGVSVYFFGNKNGETGAAVAYLNFDGNSGLIVGRSDMPTQIIGSTLAVNGSLLTLAGNLTTAGAFNSTFTMTGVTGVTFPTSGTLLTTAGSGTSLTFPGTLSIASGKTLTASNTVTFAATDGNTFTFPSGSDTVTVLAATQTLTNKRITKRVVTASDATSITPNSDSADITYQANTQAAGTLTINADGGSPTNGQSWVLKIKSTNAQTFAWNSIFVGGTVALPTVTTGGTKIDYFVFLYDSVTPKWDYTGTATGF